MKRIKFVQIIGIILFLVYVSLVIVDLLWGILYDMDNLIFSIVLAAISLTSICKGVLLKSASTLWFAVTLILTAILLVILNIYRFNADNCWFVFAIIPSISSIINLIVFKYLIYIKLIILNISVIIPIIIYKYVQFDWWISLIIDILSISLGILVSRLIKFKKEKV